MAPCWHVNIVLDHSGEMQITHPLSSCTQGCTPQHTHTAVTAPVLPDSPVVCESTIAVSFNLAYKL